VRNGNEGWQGDFPRREEAEDCAGRMRSFLVDCHEGGLGYTVRAVEERHEGVGYEFAAYSETSPYSALGRVRQKMRQGLATRHVTGSAGNYQMLHDRLRGRIAWHPEGRMVLVVDGIPLEIEDLAEILRSHEGWGFELQIADALE